MSWTKRTGWPRCECSRLAVSLSAAGWPGIRTPTAGAAASLRSVAGAGPAAWAGMILAAAGPSRASNVPSVPSGRLKPDRTAGVLAVTPRAPVRPATWPTASGAAGGIVTRSSAPTAKLACACTERCQLSRWATAMIAAAIASTATSVGPASRSARLLSCQAATGTTRPLPLDASRSPRRAASGSARSVSRAPPASASTGATTRTGSALSAPFSPPETGPDDLTSCQTAAAASTTTARSALA